MKACLLDADYIDENNQSVIRLFCKSNKNLVCLDYDFEPYFYILPKQGKESEVKKRIEAIKSIRIKRIEIEEKIIDGEKRKFVKVFCFLSTDVPKVRDIVKQWEKGREDQGIVEDEYEYSISFYRQYLLDKQINGMDCIEIEGDEIEKGYKADRTLKIKKIRPLESKEIPDLKLMAFDIECVEEDGKQIIVMLSLKSKNFEKVLTYQEDEHYEKYVEVVRNEKELLEKFVDIVNKQKPDILLGYNSDAFDMQVIQQRSEELKVKLALSKDSSELKFARRARISAARFKGLVHVDLFEFINNILSPQMQTEVMTLDAVSAELLGDNKIEIEYEEMLEDWRKGKDLAKLAEYCLKDSELTLRLGEFILPQIYELSRLSGQILFDTSRMTYSQLVEWYLSKKAYLMNNIIPNQPKWEEIQKRREVSPYEGAFVKEPIAGLHENVAVMDFRSVHYDEPVVLMNNENLIITKIGNFVDKNLNNKSVLNGAEIANLEGWKVLCFDEDYEMNFKPISQISRHPNSEKLIHIRTKSGREIRVTPTHSIFSLDNDFVPKPLIASETKVGDYILIPKSLKTPIIFNEKINLLKLFSDSKDLYVSEPSGKSSQYIKRRLRLIEILNGSSNAKTISQKLGITLEGTYVMLRKLLAEGLLNKNRNNYLLTSKGKEFYSFWSNLINNRRYDPNHRSYKYDVEKVKSFILNTNIEDFSKWNIGIKNCKSRLNMLLDTKTFASLLGWYVSEGCLSKSIKKEKWRKGIQYQYKVNITPVKSEECKEIITLLESLGFKYSKRKDGIIMSSKIYYELINSTGSGKVSYEKDVPPFIFLCDKEARMEFILSYLKGDGHCYGNYYTATSASKNLINSISLLSSSLNLYTTLFEEKERVKSKIRGKIIKTSKSYYIIIKGFGKIEWKSFNYPFIIPKKLCPKGFKTKNREILFRNEVVEWLEKKGCEIPKFLRSDLAVDKVVSVTYEEYNKEYVYDIGVNPTQNFVAGFGGIIAHNSLYPSIIATFNISPETFNRDNCKDGYQVPGTKYWFCKKRKGFVSTVIKELIEKRTELKEKMKKLKKNSEEWNRLDNEQFSIKTIANAAYGYYNFAGSKWYCRECALSSAAFGRFYIKKVIDEAGKEGFIVIYADTDSMFVKIKGDLRRKTESFLEKMNKTLPGIVELDLQGIYKRAIFIPRGIGPGTAKKRYALSDEKGVLTVRGLETVRKDWCKLAKDVQRKVLELILNKKDVNGAIKYTQNVIKDLKQKKVPLKDLIIYEQLTKPLSEYKAIGPHTVAARKIRDRGRPIGEGMVIMFVITKGKGSISERAEPIEDVSIKDIDIDYYITHQIVPAALRVLTVLGVSEEQLLGRSLKSFLK